MNQKIIGFLLLLAAVTLLAIPGDLNGDGLLDIADLARLDAMVTRKINADNAADLNFDGTVDNADLLLLYEAVTEGKPLPVMLVQERIQKWQENASISAGGLTVDIPCACYASPLISLSTMTPPPDFDIELPASVQMTPPVIVTNLPGRPQIEEAFFTLDVPEEHNDDAGAPMLLVGYDTPDRLQEGTAKWKYRLLSPLLEHDVTYADHKLTWRPDFALTEGFESTPIALAVIYTTAPATREATPESESETETRDDFFFERVHSFFDTSVFGTWRSRHFSFSLEYFATDSTIKYLARDFERAYAKIGDTGMPQEFSEKWGHDLIPVQVVPPPDDRSGDPTANCVAPFWLKKPYIEVPGDVLYCRQQAETCCHELFHYHQYYYATVFTALFLDEMVGTWAEFLVTGKPDSYMPDCYSSNRAPINGLYRESWAEWSTKLFESKKHHTGEHGYNLVPFARWLTNVKYPGYRIWPAVFSSSAYKSGDGIGALRAGIKEMNEKDTLAKVYREFMYDYFSRKPHVIPAETSPLMFFSKVLLVPSDRFDEVGHVTQFQSAEDMFKEGNYSHDFVVQNYGGATWMLRYDTPKQYLEDYTNAVVTFSLPENATGSISDFIFFALVKDKDKKLTVTPLDRAVFDTTANTAKIVFPLEDMVMEPLPPRDRSQDYTAIGLVACLASEDYPGDHRRSLTMSVAYEGPIILKNLAATHPGYYDPYGLMKTSADCTFTPLGDVALHFNKLTHWSGMGAGNQHVSFDWAAATLDRPKITQETEITLNITGIIRDLVSELTLSGEERPEFTGRFLLSIYRGEQGGEAGEYVSWTPPKGVEYNSVLGVPITLLVPAEKSKQSNFTIRFPVKPPPAGTTMCSYTIGLEALYLIYDKETTSNDIRSCNSVVFSIDIYAR